MLLNITYVIKLRGYLDMVALTTLQIQNVFIYGNRDVRSNEVSHNYGLNYMHDFGRHGLAEEGNKMIHKTLLNHCSFVSLSISHIQQERKIHISLNKLRTLFVDRHIE